MSCRTSLNHFSYLSRRQPLCYYVTTSESVIRQYHCNDSSVDWNLLRKATAVSVKFVPNRQARSPRDDIVLDLARFLPPFLVEDKNNLQDTKVVRPGKAAWSKS